MPIDLHMHSNVSDGEYTPERLVEMAKEMGLSAIAVSDHDTLEGSRRARVKGEELGIEIVPAVEMSASLNGVVLHVLAYYVDLGDKKFDQTLQSICAYRTERAETIIGKINAELASEGKQLIDRDELMRLGKEKPITRGDIAERLVRLGHVKERNDAFERWLNRYNIPNKEFSVSDAIAAVHEAGGIAVLAHPYSEYLSLNGISTSFSDHEKIMLDLQKEGLDGIEVYRFRRQGEDVRAKYADFAKAHGLLVTGGSDFHGAIFPGSSPTIGTGDVSDAVLSEMQSLLASRKAS